MCTNFLITAADGSQIVGRSMENATNFESQVVVRGRNQRIQSPSDLDLLKHDGLAWTTAYGYVGLNALGMDWLTDGINEKGLSVGMLNLPGTQYQTVTDKTKALLVMWFCDWVLGNFATVAEVKAALPGVQVWGPILESETTVHFPIFDAGGAGIVVEFVGGAQRVHDNPVGVCTNAPTFDWHLANIGNYTGLSPWGADPVTIGGQTFAQPGLGSGLMGIPGDSTPPSRFVRVTYMKQFADQPAGAADGVTLAFHILNTVDIPLGTSRSRAILHPIAGSQDSTEWIVVRDLTNRVYYIRTYGNLTPMQIDLGKIPFATTTLLKQPLPALPPAVDITADVVPV